MSFEVVASRSKQLVSDLTPYIGEWFRHDLKIIFIVFIDDIPNCARLQHPNRNAVVLQGPLPAGSGSGAGVLARGKWRPARISESGFFAS
jgi:hypothetical protein